MAASASVRAWMAATRLPVVVAPMFLVSTPELVLATCRAGALGTFPALNCRTTEGYEAWLDEIGSAPDRRAPFGVNLIVHKSNPRLEADLAATVKHKVPLVITSLGAVSELVDAVHSYGGLVFHDVISARHARKAAAAGVDGLVAVCAGAGGHAGTRSPFALLAEIRTFFKGIVLLAGCISTGSDVAAARVMGADLAYIGTRFIATTEAAAPDAHKAMITRAGSDDVVYTDRISGVHASFLRESLVAAGLNPDSLAPRDGAPDFGEELTAGAKPKNKAWKDIWSAGQGAAGTRDVVPVRELVARLEREYGAAAGRLVLPSKL